MSPSVSFARPPSSETRAPVVAPSGPGPVPADHRPSLAGMSRAELTEALRTIGVAERELRMRASQLWQWIYFQGAQSFDAMLNVGKPLRARLVESFSLERPHVVAEQISADGTRKMAAAPRADRPLRQGRGSRVRLHPGSRPRNAVRVEPGRLYTDLFVLPYRDAEARPQSHLARDRGPVVGGARPPRGLSGSVRSDGRSRAAPGHARRVEHRVHGDGRAAL